MGEHDELHPVVWHMAGKVGVNLNHALFEVLAFAAHCKLSASVWEPIRESTPDVLSVPSKEEVSQFVVLDRIRVWGVSYPEIAFSIHISGVADFDSRCSSNRTL
ncbi:hypothetical protein [Vulgatibacter incomptus]|uniref:hypothetical protein n=1 Tax=Vulgatibacter incomptus TaxID=1391653 RepID=UPI001969D218|nr:hypothetical protein [Vulgatibacter incomptus]